MGFITYESVAGAPVTIEADDKWVELVAKLDRIGYNNEHGYHWQDRKNGAAHFCASKVA